MLPILDSCQIGLGIYKIYESHNLLLRARSVNIHFFRLKDSNIPATVMALYNAVVGMHFLGLPYKRGSLWDFTVRFIRHRYPKAYLLQ